MNIIWVQINAQFITNDYENYPTYAGPTPLPSLLWVMMTNKEVPSFLYSREMLISNILEHPAPERGRRILLRADGSLGNWDNLPA